MKIGISILIRGFFIVEIKILEHWNEYLAEFPCDQRDIYYREEYVYLYANETDMARAIVCYDNGKILLMPFLKRRFGEKFDFETPYGYGGPVSNSRDTEWFIHALHAMYSHFVKQSYVCGFVRFHPLINNALQCSNVIDVIRDRTTISIPLVGKEENIWKENIVPRNRTKIHKAERLGLKFYAEYNFESIQKFIQLYEMTMNRVQADEFYFFPVSYYKNIVQKLKNHAFLGVIRQNERIICAAIFIYDGIYGHYHLSGGERTDNNTWASNLMLWRAALELKSLGVQELHLGGGRSSNLEDSLFNFKKLFSKNEKTFYIGKMIFAPDAYRKICESWRRVHPEKVKQYGNRLLCYRY